MDVDEPVLFSYLGQEVPDLVDRDYELCCVRFSDLIADKLSKVIFCTGSLTLVLLVTISLMVCVALCVIYMANNARVDRVYPRCVCTI